MSLPKTIVLDEHTLAVIYPNGLDVLRSSILRGSPHAYTPYEIPFDLVLDAGRYRPATEKDFEEFKVVFNPRYLKPLDKRILTTRSVVNITAPLAEENP